MELRQKEDFQGRIAQRAELANEKSTSPKEMISALSNDNIKEYLAQKKEKDVQINEQQNRPDFSDLLEL